MRRLPIVWRSALYCARYLADPAQRRSREGRCRDGAYLRRGLSNVMDEYRPFPSEQPPDEPLDDISEEETDTEPINGVAEDGAVGSRPERPAPNLDHPGGHLHGSVA